MLDAIIIFTKGGVIVWSYSFLGNAQMPWRDALDSLIKTVFLEVRCCLMFFLAGDSVVACGLFVLRRKN